MNKHDKPLKVAIKTFGWSTNSFDARAQIKVGDKSYTIFRLDRLQKAMGTDFRRLPFSIRVLVENLLRNEDGKNVRRQDIEALAHWDPKKKSDQEIAFIPARVILQDFTGVPCVVDLAAMRDAMRKIGGGPQRNKTPPAAGRR